MAGEARQTVGVGVRVVQLDGLDSAEVIMVTGELGIACVGGECDL